MRLNGIYDVDDTMLPSSLLTFYIVVDVEINVQFFFSMYISSSSQYVTLNGLIKNKERHEKDNRPDRNDARRYNERKREALFQKGVNGNKTEGCNQLNVSALQQAIHKTEGRIAKLQDSNNKLKALVEQLDEHIAERADNEEKRNVLFFTE